MQTLRESFRCGAFPDRFQQAMILQVPATRLVASVGLTEKECRGFARGPVPTAACERTGPRTGYLRQLGLPSAWGPRLGSFRR